MAESLLIFFGQNFDFVCFSHWWILFHFLFPLSLCASLDMAHRGVLRCVSPTQFSLFLFFWLRLDIVVYTCDTPLLLSKHGWLCRLLPPHFAWLPHTGGSLQQEVLALLTFLPPFNPLSLLWLWAGLLHSVALACHLRSWDSKGFFSAKKGTCSRDRVGTDWVRVPL